MTTYLVTGGAGFIGSMIAKKLVECGENVRILDNLSMGSMENIASFIKQVDFRWGDIRDEKAVSSAVQGVDYIIHHAAEISVIKSIHDPCLFNDVNVSGTLNILEAAKSHHIKRVVMASSSAVYGAGCDGDIDETMPVEPMSPYGISKYINELHAGLYHSLYGLDTVCLRYFNVYGPNQRVDSPYSAVIPIMINALLQNGQIKIYGDGEQTRDFVFVEDVAAANIAACKAEKLEERIFNVASGSSISINQLAKRICDTVGKRQTPVYLPGRDGEIIHSTASIQRITEHLNLKPRFSLEKGLAKTVDYYMSILDQDRYLFEMNG